MAVQTRDGAGGKVLIVSRDRVAAALAARLFERLGYPRPERSDSPAGADGAGFEVVLVDADLDEVRDWRPAAPARLVAMATRPLAGQLAKPLSLEALGAALKDGDGWDELLRMFGQAGVARMVEVLERDLPQLEVVLGEALDGEDRSGLRRQAHTLRGVAQQLGAPALADQCTATEAAGRDAPWPDVVAGVRAMLAQYKAVLRRLRERLDGG